jgi:hypothetical protein
VSKCSLHPFTDATRYCTGCERPLCEECGTRLSYCGACGAPVVAYGEEAPEHWFDDLFEKVALRTGEGDLVVFAILHAVVPAAIIGMVYSFLFYLLLVRSIFFGNTGVLQWVGFLFVVATVLTARYGRTRNDKATQALYSLVLFGATGLALTTRSPTTAAAVANMVLLTVVWLYATGVTYALSLEGKGEKSTRGAVAPVVALGIVAMVVFAGGEPLMLNADTDIAIQAIVAIIGYLVSTGVALAAASTVSQARRAYRTRGDVALGVMRERVGAALALGLVVVAIGLTLPGVRYTGSGRLELSPDEVLQQRRWQRGMDPTAGAIGEMLTGGLPWGWLSGFESLTTQSGQAAAALAVVKFMQFFGVVVALVIAISAMVFAARQRTDLFDKLAPRLQRYLAWLRGKLVVPAWARRDGARRRRHTSDPFAGLDELAVRPVREAVMEAYLRSTVLLERLDYPRPVAATPYDLLGALPDRLSSLNDPLSEITGLYVRAAYSNEELRAADRDGAVATLVAMRDLLAAERADG